MRMNINNTNQASSSVLAQKPESPREIGHKIVPIDKLAPLCAQAQHEGRIVVHCHGVFDLLHIGHIRYFEQAKRMGNLLIVTVTPDRYVDKGPHRPAFSQSLRCEAIASLTCVDYVAINQWPTAVETLKQLKPDIYVKGAEFRDIDSDPTGKIGQEATMVEKIGARLAFTDDIVFSSTNLINRHLSTLPKELDDYLHLLRSRFTADDVMDILRRMQQLRVVIIGDTIIDQYNYCQAIGKSSKDPVLAVKQESCDTFAGGVLAVANHVAEFTQQVTLISVLGDKPDQRYTIHKQLHSSISTNFTVHAGTPTIIKQRFIDGYSCTKLFEVYHMTENPLPAACQQSIDTAVAEAMTGADLVIASDFGHGAITRQTVQTLCRHAPLLCVNTQANAGNRGFNTISKYPRADFICLAEHEMRLEACDQRESIHALIAPVHERLGCRHSVVTQGRKGALVCSGHDQFVQVPTFAQTPVDRVGAGDAFFAVASLAAGLDVPAEIIGFLGNIAGTIAVEIIGNKKPVGLQQMRKLITSLMK